ncbi:Mitochondrial ABC-transporter N-terminal five TM domain [Trinorchestia longiramus]|nr:Mitochondrial ABC-transporter N-terminal five TM domain [Trinorchestia longiramus]
MCVEFCTSSWHWSITSFVGELPDCKNSSLFAGQPAASADSKQVYEYDDDGQLKSGIDSVITLTCASGHYFQLTNFLSPTIEVKCIDYAFQLQNSHDDSSGRLDGCHQVCVFNVTHLMNFFEVLVSYEPPNAGYSDGVLILAKVTSNVTFSCEDNKEFVFNGSTYSEVAFQCVHVQGQSSSDPTEVGVDFFYDGINLATAEGLKGCLVETSDSTSYSVDPTTGATESTPATNEPVTMTTGSGMSTIQLLTSTTESLASTTASLAGTTESLTITTGSLASTTASLTDTNESSRSTTESLASTTELSTSSVSTSTYEGINILSASEDLLDTVTSANTNPEQLINYTVATADLFAALTGIVQSTDDPAPIINSTEISVVVDNLLLTLETLNVQAEVCLNSSSPCSMDLAALAAVRAGVYAQIAQLTVALVASGCPELRDVISKVDLYMRVTSSTYGLLLLVFGLGQWLMYKRYATLNDTSIIRPKSSLMVFQFILMSFMPLLTLVHFILLATIIGDKTIYGYEIVFFLVNIIVWPLCARLVLLERYYQLPTVPSNGHGIVLLLFWTLVFIAENLTFINLRNEDWWFDLSNTSDRCEFALFVLRYSASCLLFVIGIKAPAVAIDTNATQLTPLLADPSIQVQYASLPASWVPPSQQGLSGSGVSSSATP